MSKIELDDITSGYSVAKINNNFQKIENEINNKMLSRQPGTEPNVMLDVLDMNSNRIINLPAPVDPTDPIRLMDVDLDISGITIDSDFALIRASAEPTPLDGKMWFDKVDGLYVGDEGQWKPVSGSGNSTGGGIVYSDVLPTALTEGVTFFDASRMEHVYTYADDDSVQYLTAPLLVGSGGGSFGGGGSASGYSTFVTADLDGASLVGTGSTPQEHKIKSLKAGAGITFEDLGASVTIKADLVDTVEPLGVGLVKTTPGTTEPKKAIKKLIAGTGVTLSDDGNAITVASTGGGTGGGIVYTETLPPTIAPGTTYYVPNTSEQVFSYNDGDSSQYLAYPLLGGSPSGGGGSSGGGSSTVLSLNQSGTSADGVGTFSGDGSGNFFFKRLKAGSVNNIVLTENADNITIDALDVVNAGGGGAALVKTKTTTQYPIKRLLAGTNITLTEGTDAVTINAAGGSGGALGDTLTRLQGIAAENNNVPVFTASGASQFLTTASTRALMGLSTVPNTFPYFTGSTTADLATLTPFMLSMLSKTGVPTALSHLKITSGNTANGGWLRIGVGDTSGVQFCWHAIVCNSATTAQGSGFVGPNATWTFPLAFNGLPSVSSSVQDGVQAWVSNGSGGNSASSASFRQNSFINGPGNSAVSVMAIGFY